MFRRVFNDKKSLLELYNAVNGTSYTDEDELTIVTLEDAIYMNVKNDIAFLVGTYLNLYEHQSTVNPNMPIRCLIYIAKEYEKLLDKSSLYSSRQQQIPTPRFIVFVMVSRSGGTYSKRMYKREYPSGFATGTKSRGDSNVNLLL